MRSRALSAAAALLVAGASGSALANPLNLLLQNHPDVFSSFIDVAYNAAANSLTLTADGFSINVDDDGNDMTPAYPISNGIFQITMVVDNAGVASSGSLMISGAVPGLGIPQGTLLSADLLAFGFSPNGTFEFKWGNLGGSPQSLAPLFLAVGNEAGTILSDTGYPGSFANSWNNNGGFPGFGNAVSDTAPLVPAPASIGLVALGGLLAGRRRR